MTLAADEFANEDDSELFKAIKIQDWELVERVLSEKPGLVRVPDRYGNLPLHSAIGFRCPDDGLLLRILDSHPEACRVHGTDDWLPLRIGAMWGVSARVLEALIEAHPQALDDCGDPGIKGRTPRHFATRFPHNREALERSTEEWIAYIEKKKKLKEREEEEGEHRQREEHMDRKRAFDRARIHSRAATTDQA